MVGGTIELCSVAIDFPGEVLQVPAVPEPLQPDRASRSMEVPGPLWCGRHLGKPSRTHSPRRGRRTQTQTVAQSLVELVEFRDVLGCCRFWQKTAWIVPFRTCAAMTFSMVANTAAKIANKTARIAENTAMISTMTFSSVFRLISDFMPTVYARLYLAVTTSGGRMPLPTSFNFFPT